MASPETEDLEVFKIGRTRILFPPDITEDEFQLLAMIMYSYIQTMKYKGAHPSIWKITDRLDGKEKRKDDVGVS